MIRSYFNTKVPSVKFIKPFLRWLLVRPPGDVSPWRPSRFTSGRSYCPNLFTYSSEEMNALTISAAMKLPLNWFSFPSQKL